MYCVVCVFRSGSTSNLGMLRSGLQYVRHRWGPYSWQPLKAPNSQAAQGPIPMAHNLWVLPSNKSAVAGENGCFFQHFDDLRDPNPNDIAIAVRPLQSSLRLRRSSEYSCAPDTAVLP